jgi:hypothetical protein
MVEYYISTLHPSIGMFVKKDLRPTLVHKFEEAKEVEKKCSL